MIETTHTKPLSDAALLNSYRQPERDFITNNAGGCWVDHVSRAFCAALDNKLDANTLYALLGDRIRDHDGKPPMSAYVRWIELVAHKDMLPIDDPAHLFAVDRIAQALHWRKAAETPTGRNEPVFADRAAVHETTAISAMLAVVYALIARNRANQKRMHRIAFTLNTVLEKDQNND